MISRLSSAVGRSVLSGRGHDTDRVLVTPTGQVDDDMFADDRMAADDRSPQPTARTARGRGWVDTHAQPDVLLPPDGGAGRSAYGYGGAGSGRQVIEPAADADAYPPARSAPPRGGRPAAPPTLPAGLRRGGFFDDDLSDAY